MNKSQNTKNEQLTEQMHKDELPEGWYYVIKTGDVEMLEYSCNCFLAVDVPLIDNEVTEVLAPVPSYDEWKASYNCMLENEVLRLKNAQLKELLKECSIANTALVSIMDWLRKSTIPEQRENCAKLFKKTQELQKRLDEVLK